ncbi:phosphate acyltransferase PlsX [Texas Phoenix palm phytoplasma]|uniref:Phosphate acyltransferase n=1 Tax=Texas Phoenix palm phytoplasma TaxID=176709 RepID=A0ABS5BIC8_9MOLU|nr:phosphate acyltransferase PlsX [Texas Phoenix palm phytoplasma]MBP3059338.1 phosphate acyltransferase PlsX [Texas Phoenix palm phytoplasma]
MIKLAVDAMGGDFAPEVIIKGVCKALSEEKDLYIVLFGNKNKIEKILNEQINKKLYTKIKKNFHIIHTPFFIDSNIQNIREEIRNNVNNSMFLSIKAAQNNEVEGVISAGPTQALVLYSFLMLQKLEGMNRIALAPIFNSPDKRKRILLDAGANIDVTKENMLKFAICASTVAKELLNIENPIIKLLNIGTEKNKGRQKELELYNLLEKDKNINFKGNEEPQNILISEADILLSDAFTCNMVLKSYKGAIKQTILNIKKILSNNLLNKIISKLLFAKKLKKLNKKLDSKEIGGAMLLGLNKIVIKAHGDSNEYAFYKAILQGKTLIEKKFLHKIMKNLQSNKN